MRGRRKEKIGEGDREIEREETTNATAIRMGKHSLRLTTIDQIATTDDTISLVFLIFPRPAIPCPRREDADLPPLKSLTMKVL